MATDDLSKDDLSKVEERIKELGDKSSQTLLFLSFALVVAATLKDKSDPAHQVALYQAMCLWSWALFPILLGILPLKEIRNGNHCWYTVISWLKFILLWVAIAIIAWGASEFIRAIQQVFPN